MNFRWFLVIFFFLFNENWDWVPEFCWPTCTLYTKSVQCTAFCTLYSFSIYVLYSKFYFVCWQCGCLKSRVKASMRTLLRRTARREVRMYTREMSNMILLPGNTVWTVKRTIKRTVWNVKGTVKQRGRWGCRQWRCRTWYCSRGTQSEQLTGQ